MRVCIVGLGLMGASLGRALRERELANVSGVDINGDARAVATRGGCVDSAGDDLAEACSTADLVVVCTPISEIEAAVHAALAAAPESATVTDIGSTKASLVASVDRVAGRRFVGGHPMCGAETRGPGGARSDLFEGAKWFLTPTATTDPTRYAALHSLIGRLGARPVAIEATAHDRLLAITSHLPHVIANGLAAQAGAGTIEGHDPLAAAGPSFRDMTRIAGSNARVWVDIWLDNREALLDVLGEYRRRLDEVAVALEREDAGYLSRFVGQAAQARRRSLEAAFPAQAGDLYTLRIRLADRPGAISTIAQALGAAQINIEDFALRHESVDRGAAVEITVVGEAVATLASAVLDEHGYVADVALAGEPPTTDL